MQVAHSKTHVNYISDDKTEKSFRCLGNYELEAVPLREIP